jgi:dihydrofolate reductase
MSWLTDYLGPTQCSTSWRPESERCWSGGAPTVATIRTKAPRPKARSSAGPGHGPQFVLTNRPPDDTPEGVTFAEDLPTVVAAARVAAGDHYVNVLCASVAAQCLEAGELDEVLVTIVPLLLGDGVRLFERAGGVRAPLEPVSVTHTDVVTNVWFRVIRP